MVTTTQDTSQPSDVEVDGLVQLIALDQIRTDANVRESLDGEQIAALAASIELIGQITPAIVRAHEDGGYVLVASHRRYAALAQLGRTETRAEIRAGEAEQVERAAENIVRAELNAYEEAKAVQAILGRG